MVFIYDVETFPNYFSVLMISEDGQQEFVFEKYNGVDQLPAMVQFLTTLPDLTLVGYNSIDYDDIMLRCVIEKPDMTNRQLFAVSSAIIKADSKKDLPTGLRNIAYADSPWKTVDLLQLLQVNMNRPSLKHCSIHLEHEWLQDLPLPFDALVKPDMIPTIVRYNRNDVQITSKLYLLGKIQDAIFLRRELGKLYGVDLLSAGDSKIANVIFEARYGTPELRETRRPEILGSDLIPPTLDFRTPEMQAVVQKLQRTRLIENEPYKHVVIYEDGPRSSKNYYYNEDDDVEQGENFEHEFMFNGVKFVMGQGGLHTDDPPRKIKPADDMFLRDADVGSYYPSLILRYGLVPGHLDKERFLAIYNEIVQERLQGKRSGDKVKADGLKIAINGAFGKLNFPYFWLYDPLAFYRVTLYGQLLLLDLIEKLYLAGINCISANTDGIVCHFSRDKEAEYNAVCDEWSARTGMNLEYTDYELLVQLNVNSYMSLTTTGKLKTKKDFEDGKELDKQTFVKGYNAPVIALALQAYFRDGIEPETFIRGHKNIHDFFYTQRAGAKFKIFLVTGERWEELQKTNRYYVSTSGGSLVKKDKTVYRQVGAAKGRFQTERQTRILKGELVEVLNNIPENPNNNIKYDFYIQKAREIIEKIEPKKPVAKMKSIF